MKEDDKWVENLRNKLEDYSEPLPDALWERLEEELSAPRVIPIGGHVALLQLLLFWS